MGACLEPTPAMGPYNVEVRSHSFYLNRTRNELRPFTVAGWHELTVESAEMPAILAAFEQVKEHPVWGREEWRGDDPEDTAWTVPFGKEGEAPSATWAVSRDGEAVTIHGPWTVYSSSDPSHYLPFSAEIAYVNLSTLDEALKALAS